MVGEILLHGASQATRRVIEMPGGDGLFVE